jgi:hypothetical protein
MLGDYFNQLLMARIDGLSNAHVEERQTKRARDVEDPRGWSWQGRRHATLPRGHGLATVATNAITQRFLSQLRNYA